MPRFCPRILTTALAAAHFFAGSAAQSATEDLVSAVVESTLPTANGQPRQLAFDGNLDTFYISARNPTDDDHLTLILDRAVPVTLISVNTGRADGQDELEAGTLEVSADGKAFEPLSRVRDGSVRADARGRKIRAVRLRPEIGVMHPLVVREIAIVSEPPVARFRYPVEIVTDVSDAPEMKEWADKVARLCERAYPMINEELKSGSSYRPPSWITMRLRKDYRGVAMAGGSAITGSVRYFKEHPDDVGAMVHETVHVVQHYRGRNPSWLVEGVSDYVRFFKFEPGKLGRIDPKRAHYNQSYRVTAAFLAYLTTTYDAEIVPKLNHLMRGGKYNEKVFQELTGKTVQELDDEWRATLDAKS